LGGRSLSLLGTFVFCSTTNNVKFILPLYGVLAILLTGLFVLSYNPQNKVNQSFFLLTLNLAIWGFFLSMFQHSGEFVFGQLTYASASFLPFSFLLFTKVFPEDVLSMLNNKIIFIFFVLSLIFSILSFSDKIIKSTISLGWGYTLELGNLYYLFAIYFLCFIGIGFTSLMIKHKKSLTTRKLQIHYFFIASFGTAFVGISTAIILPLFGFSRLYYLAPASNLILVVIISYAILKHRLMDITVVISRTAAEILIISTLGGIYLCLVWFHLTYISQTIDWRFLIWTILYGIMIGHVYMPILLFIETSSYKIFFYKHYDYQKTLKEISQRITTQIRLEDLAKLLAYIFVETMKTSEMSLLILERDKLKYRSVPITFIEGASIYKKIEINFESPIAKWLSSHKDALILDEIEEKISKIKSIKRKEEQTLKFLLEVKEEMDQLGGALWIPVISNNELIGIIFSGYKISGDAFTTEDITLLLTLGNQVAIALENSKLYEEVLTVKNYTQDMVNAFVSGVLTVDMYGNLVAFNPMAENLTGLNLKNLTGKNYREIFPKESRITHVLEETLKNRYLNNFEANITNNQKIIPVSLSSAVLRNSHGRKIGALLTITDLTDMKALEERVRQSDKVAALGTLAAGMAHEIKNPLTSMNALSQLLPARRHDDEFIDKVIEIMPKEISRINRIVEMLMEFIRSTTPNLSLVSIKDILEENIKYFKEQADKSSVKIEAKFADVPLVEADQEQISQVFSNLMLNSIQAMPRGGTLKVEIREGRKVENVLQTIEVEVSDTGHGISPDNIKKLFDPFFTTKHAGTGLGLSISHSIIDNHKGTMNVKSEPEKGTSFIVILPMKQN